VARRPLRSPADLRVGALLVIVVVGIAGYVQLGVDRFPNIDFPVVVVIANEPGAAPEDVETEITDKIEEAVNTISGSTSSAR